MGEAKRRRENGEGPRSRIPEGFVKGWGEFYFGMSDPPEPVRASAEIAEAMGRPFVPVGTMYTMRDDAEGPPIVILLRHGCDYGAEIKNAGTLAMASKSDVYLSFNHEGDWNKFSRGMATRHGH